MLLKKAKFLIGGFGFSQQTLFSSPTVKDLVPEHGDAIDEECAASTICPEALICSRSVSIDKRQVSKN